MNMDRTKAALAAYEEAKQEGWATLLRHPDPKDEHVFALEALLDDMGRKVGRAFGLDTRNFNSLDTCEECVRPGPWLSRVLPKMEAHVG